MPPVNLMGYAEKIKKANYSGTVSNDRIIPDDAYLDIGNGVHSNINLMKNAAINSIPKFQKYQKGEFTKKEFTEFMATIIYQCMLDPNFTGNTIENPYQLVNFFDVNITSNEIIIIKKYYPSVLFEPILFVILRTTNKAKNGNERIHNRSRATRPFRKSDGASGTNRHTQLSGPTELLFFR